LFSEKIIVGILSEPEPVKELVRKLIQAAKDAGGKDNITVILIKCAGKGE
jgi:serine/threonine protein phosphatase PrpC